MVAKLSPCLHHGEGWLRFVALVAHSSVSGKGAAIEPVAGLSGPMETEGRLVKTLVQQRVVKQGRQDAGIFSAFDRHSQNLQIIG